MGLRTESEEAQTDAVLTLVMLITLIVSPSARRILTPVCNTGLLKFYLWEMFFAALLIKHGCNSIS